MPIRQHCDEDEQGEYAKETQNRRDPHIVSVFGVAGIDTCAFDPDEDEYGDQHRVADLI